MKKIVTMLIIICFSILLVSCNKVEEKKELKDLPYYTYLEDSNPEILIEVKGFGTMKAQLFPKVAANTVNNFIDYITEKAYTKSTFHRIISDFMIQGGIVNNTKDSINGEFMSNGFKNKLNHNRGVLSMARTNYFNSATSQFFIMHKDSPHLDGNYATFGALTSGFDVLDKIANVNTINDAPIKDVVIESITVELNGYKPSSVVYS
ncbi:Peptidyl-prolyl cis-trans isomerase [Alteracholeplasma palmae J233]|uniref:Peptidyl-prolyl cis-trans isomerase n=1 Tax=Alteracholeplasma palmae (strain ATCC 49389 / J233) TaxID=1318466 RepID=U4KQ72_ALTPJ|nr:peptidylprolyl isomerase [Alteracholeplasma palmae]CCV64425.1 Peptidyl-prolyl cis-trans isomerase [Alteracholeplasma palmae J233]